MRNIALAAALALAACAPTGDPTKDAATAQGYIVAFQPLASEVACQAQAGANVAGKLAEAASDTTGAAVASGFSLANGLFCNGLPVGALLPQPVTSPLPVAALGAVPVVAPK